MSLPSQIKTNALKCSNVYRNKFTSLFSSIKVLSSSFTPNDRENHDYSEHKHSIYEIHMAITGSFDVIIEQETAIHLNQQQYVIIPKNCVHKLANVKTDSMRFVIAFDMKDDMDKVFFKDIKKRTISPGVLNTISILLSDEISDSNAFCRYSLICGLAVDLYLDYTNASLSNNSNNTYIRMMQRFLKDNLDVPVTIPDILEYCCCSQRNMNRILKQEMGTNLRNIIKNHRLNLIIELLCKTNKSLKEIAELTGYESEYALSHFFSDEMKISPSRYRKQNSH